MRAAPAYRVWFRDDAGCAEAIRTQEPVEVALSA
jgi:hypothetical protein